MAPKTTKKTSQTLGSKKRSAPSKKGSTKTKRTTKKQIQSLSTYIYKTLKQVHPDTGIMRSSMIRMDNLLHEITDKIIRQALTLVKVNKKQTVASRDIQTAVWLVLPGELAKHAVSEGTKAVTKYNTSDGGSSGKPISKSQRAGLIFPPSRFFNMIKADCSGIRVGETAGIYLAAVIEYLGAEILELAGNASRDTKLVRIKPSHITKAIREDEELTELHRNL